MSELDTNKLTICRLHHSSPITTKQPVVITHCVIVHEDLSWELFVHGHVVDIPNCQALSSFGSITTTEKVNEILVLLTSLNVCIGHPDKHFIELCNARKGQFVGKNGEIVAIKDDYCPVVVNGGICNETIRTSKCEMVVTNERCSKCKHHRSALRSMHTRFIKHDSEKCSQASSHTNYRYLKTPERKKRMSRLKSQLDESKRAVEKLEAQDSPTAISTGCQC